MTGRAYENECHVESKLSSSSLHVHVRAERRQLELSRSLLLQREACTIAAKIITKERITKSERFRQVGL